MPQAPQDRANSMRRILVVDDETKICRVFADHFAMKGCEVRNVCRGEEAIAIAGVFRPDVILLDLLMPGLDGVETLKQLRQVTPASKVIMVSAADHEDVVRGALQLGVDFYVCKPVNLDELDHLVNGFFPPLEKR